MRVEFSPFLTDQKENLRQLIAALTPYFSYVSVLGTDNSGKQFLVQKTGSNVSDSRWTERGFVVRVYDGARGRYFEYSYNQPLPAATLAETIRAKANEAFTSVDSSGIHSIPYPVINEKPLQHSYHGEVAVPPGSISTAAKVRQLTAIHEKALSYPMKSGDLVDCRVRYEEVYVSKIFVSKQRDLEQSYIWSQGYLIPIVRRDGQTKFCYRSFSGLHGPELLETMTAAPHAAVALAERLLDAKPAEPGEYNVICSPEVAGLIAHEAFGHGVEMDMFVKNRAKAVEYLGKPVASNLVTMHDGAAAASHVSSYFFDDEGNSATDTVVIDRGILKAGISDQLSAMKLGTVPTGNGKRESFERKAYARMTNTFFAAGTDRLNEMIGSIRHGYLLDGMMSGMEDPKNWGIQCMILWGEEIRDGKLTGNLISPVVMTGYVPDLLKAVSMVSTDVELFGSGACGKGHKEWAKVSDGGPYIKTRARLG
ncbi:MAG TPA: TldD/PmbA family protein [Bacillota bacterium]